MYWELDLNYQIQVQQISFDIQVHVSPNHHIPTTPVAVTIGGQTQSYQPVGFGTRTATFEFNFDNWVTSDINLFIAQVRSPITDENWNGDTNTSVDSMSNLAITANVAQGHPSAYQEGRIDDYIDLGDRFMQAQDFEIVSDGNILTMALLVGEHAIRLSIDNSTIRVFCYETHPLGAQRVSQNISEAFRGFWIRFENNQINVWNRFTIPATPTTVIEVSTTFLAVMNTNTGHSGNPGVIRGWQAEPPVTDRTFTVYVRDLDNQPIGYITFEMDLSGSLIISQSWILTNLPAANIPGQSIDGFFLVDRNTNQIGTNIIHQLGVTNETHNNVTIAMNYSQITHTVTWIARIDGVNHALHSLILNWGETIPTLTPTLELPQVRGWTFLDWDSTLWVWDNPILGEGLAITQDVTITARHRQLEVYVIRFADQWSSDWGWTSFFTFAQITIYEGDVINLDEVIAFYPRVPVSQFNVNILDDYTWGGQWIARSGFMVGHILDDQPIVRESGLQRFLEFIPLVERVEFVDILLRLNREDNISVFNRIFNEMAHRRYFNMRMADNATGFHRASGLGFEQVAGINNQSIIFSLSIPKHRYEALTVIAQEGEWKRVALAIDASFLSGTGWLNWSANNQAIVRIGDSYQLQNIPPTQDEDETTDGTSRIIVAILLGLLCVYLVSYVAFGSRKSKKGGLQ